MAETRKIVVEIIDKSDTSIVNNNTTNINNTTNNTEINLTNILHPIKSAERHLLGKSILLNQAYNVAKSGINQAINLSMTRYFNMKEDYIGQNNFNNFMSGVNLVSNVGTSIIGGAIAGAKIGGGYGAIIGGAIGGIGAGVNLFMGYEGRMSSYYSSLNASNYQTGFMRTRAGLTDGSKGTEN